MTAVAIPLATVQMLGIRPESDCSDLRGQQPEVPSWPNPDLPFSGENRKNRTFTRGSETGLPRRGRSRREHALAEGPARQSSRWQRYQPPVVVSGGNFNAEDHKRHIEAPLRQGLGDFPFIHLMKLDLGIRVFLAPIDEQAAERLSTGA